MRDTCQQDTPDGREKAIGASGTILDPGFNAKLRARYLGGLITWEYWVLDHAEDYSWFISSDPKFEKLWIYTREVPDAAGRAGFVVESVRSQEPVGDAGDGQGSARTVDRQGIAERGVTR